MRPKMAFMFAKLLVQALASHIQQGCSLRIDDVLLCYGYLYGKYRRIETIERGRQWSSARVEQACLDVLAQLEMLWRSSEQQLLIAAVILNPFVGIKRAGFNTSAEKLGPEACFRILDQLYRRLYKRAPGLAFAKQWESYSHSAGMYSEENLKVEKILRDARVSVCMNPSDGFKR